MAQLLASRIPPPNFFFFTLLQWKIFLHMTLDPEFFKLGTYNYIKIYVGHTSGEFYAYNIYVYIRCSNICT